MGKVNFEKDLDSIQLAAVKSTKRFVRIIAGAGSGKTTALTYRFAYLVQRLGIPHNRILCVTFTRKATGEMKSRIDGMLVINSNTVMTFNALGLRILIAEKEYLGWHEDCDVIDQDDNMISVIKEILECSPFEKPQVSIEEIVAYITKNKLEINYLSYLNPEDRSLDLMINSALEANKLDEYIFYAYLEYQRKYYKVDFTDQARIPLLLFDTFPEIRERWQRKFHHILVDEFQDVSDLNYRLCEELTGNENSLFVVGDPDQVIYTWRDRMQHFIEGLG